MDYRYDDSMSPEMKKRVFQMIDTEDKTRTEDEKTRVYESPLGDDDITPQFDASYKVARRYSHSR